MEVDSFLSEAVGWETISDDLGSDLQAATPLLVRPTREHPYAELLQHIDAALTDDSTPLVL